MTEQKDKVSLGQWLRNQLGKKKMSEDAMWSAIENFADVFTSQTREEDPEPQAPSKDSPVQAKLDYASMWVDWKNREEERKRALDEAFALMTKFKKK